MTEEASERIRLQQLLALGETRVHSLAVLELDQQRRKAFVDRHRGRNEEMFGYKEKEKKTEKEKEQENDIEGRRHAGPNSQKRKYVGTQILGNLPFFSHTQTIYKPSLLSQLSALSQLHS